MEGLGFDDIGINIEDLIIMMQKGDLKSFVHEIYNLGYRNGVKSVQKELDKLRSN